MNYGLHMAASGALTALYRMDVLQNNLSNLETPGFKPDIPSLQQRDAERVEKGEWSLPSNRMLERLGGGVFAAPNWVKFDQGQVQTTGNSLDVAIKGSGFFVVRDDVDVTQRDRYRLTRDGRFLRDAQGRLASATSGMPVMDIANRPIVISSDAPVTIQENGSIVQHGTVVAQIQVSDVSDTSHLRRLGRSLFQAPTDVMANRRPAAGTLVQGSIEASGVDPIRTLMGINDAARAVDTAIQLMQGHDRIAERAINGLGRVA